MKLWKRLARCGCLLLFAAGLLEGALAAESPWDDGSASADSGTNNACVLRMTYPFDRNISCIGDIEEIEEAVNAITAREIGAVVELQPVDMSESQENYMLWLARGDTIDLMLVRGQDIAVYIDSGFLNPLNSYLKWNAESIVSAEQETDGMLTKGAQQQGRTYGIANLTGQEAEGYGLWISESVLKAAEIPYDPDHIYTMEEIDRILGILKRLYPDSYPLGQITSRQNGSSAKYFIAAGDSLGSDPVTGVVFSENDTVVNPFRTEEYADFLSYMRRWYEAEYVFPDAVTYDASVKPLLEEKTILMYPESSCPGTMDRLLGHESDYVCMRTVETVRRNDYSGDGYWTIPVTANYPEEAMKFLNLMYENKEIISLLNYGIEGKHYIISDSGERLWIQSGEGEKKESAFYNPAARIGDLRELSPFGTSETCRDMEAFDSQAEEKGNRYGGFNFMTSKTSRQTEAVRETAEAYLPVLESGSVDDTSAYPEFLESLDAAGITGVIADKQSQLDEWMERNDAESGRLG